jgi:hypothetical protein
MAVVEFDWESVFASDEGQSQKERQNILLRCERCSLDHTIKAKVDHKFPTDDGPGKTSEVHS